MADFWNPAGSDVLSGHAMQVQVDFPGRIRPGKYGRSSLRRRDWLGGPHRNGGSL